MSLFVLLVQIEKSFAHTLQSTSSQFNEHGEEKIVGKDQLAARHLRQARTNLYKTLFFLGLTLLILIGLGGMIGIIVHYVQTHRSEMTSS